MENKSCPAFGDVFLLSSFNNYSFHVILYNLVYGNSGMIDSGAAPGLKGACQISCWQDFPPKGNLVAACLRRAGGQKQRQDSFPRAGQISFQPAGNYTHQIEILPAPKEILP